jgi:hypothetical protein
MEHFSDFAVGTPVVVEPSQYDPSDTWPGVWYVVGPAALDGDMRLGRHPGDDVRLYVTWRRVRRFT